MERLLGPASAVKDTGGDAQAGERRSSSRVKKMAVKVADAIADEAARQRMVSARLNALESDYTAGGRSQGRKGGVDGDDDVEFMGDGDDEAHVGRRQGSVGRFYSKSVDTLHPLSYYSFRSLRDYFWLKTTAPSQNSPHEYSRYVKGNGI
eukprot:TRINITY_DN638_c0_g1_i3.p1 TRINITY_DN638_c0_g1~~TRINITY_DN638_c0_g1_i3.p1  ORF type:complete len:150 (+),score=30.22 TRINITY_DN638_c0_g1_i3:126-575(+)